MATETRNYVNPVRGVGKWLLAPISEHLTREKVDPNDISETGEKLAKTVAAVLMNQDIIASQVSNFLNISPTKARWGIRAIGGAIWTAGIICDAIDGDVAERANKKTPYGKWLDAVIDRRVDLFPWPFHRINSQHPIDTAIAEVNAATNTIPALLKTVKPDVPELAIGSRFPRLVTLTAF